MSEKLEKNENAIPLTPEQAEQVSGGAKMNNSGIIGPIIGESKTNSSGIIGPIIGESKTNGPW